MRFELIIFDWDGTLADSTGRIVDSMRVAGQRVGMPAVPDSNIQNIIGLGLPEALKTVWPDITEEQLAAMRIEYARLFVDDSKVPMQLFPGTREMLSRLQHQGRQLAVATGKSRKGLDRLLNDLELVSTFNITRCADETRSKPDPLMLKEILSELGVSEDKALMVGDTTYDLDMANALGMATVAMSHGAHDEPRLLSREPEALLHSIEELESWITHS